MAKRIYLVRENIFHDEGNVYKGKPSAIAYCKKNGISQDEIVELYNDSELVYYRLLQEKVAKGEIKSVRTHQKKIITNGFTNARGENIPAMVVDIPFEIVGDGYVHYINLVTDFKSLTRHLLTEKILFDYFYKKEEGYIRIVYQGNDGKYKDYRLEDYGKLKAEFQSEEHKRLLEQHRAVRERQKYDRLLKLREEGKITDNQRKELYRLEELYERH